MDDMRLSMRGGLQSFLRQTPLALWSLLERDPSEVCVIDERGEPTPGQGPASVPAWREALIAAGAECRECRYLSHCDGYLGSDNHRHENLR